MKRIIGILIVFSLLAFGCSVTENQKKIYDNEKMLISSDDFYTYQKSSINTSIEGGSTKFSNFTGMDTLWEIKGSGTLTVEYSGECKQGKFKLVLVKVKDSIIKEVSLENSYEGTFDIKLEEGKYALKTVGLDTGGICNIKLEVDGDLEIKDNH